MRMKMGRFLGINYHGILHSSAPLPTSVSLCDLSTSAYRRIDFRFASRSLLSDLGNLLLEVALDPQHPSGRLSLLLLPLDSLLSKPFPHLRDLSLSYGQEIVKSPFLSFHRCELLLIFFLLFLQYCILFLRFACQVFNVDAQLVFECDVLADVFL